jgi:hypothetical protein
LVFQDNPIITAEEGDDFERGSVHSGVEEEKACTGLCCRQSLLADWLDLLVRGSKDTPDRSSGL